MIHVVVFIAVIAFFSLGLPMLSWLRYSVISRKTAAHHMELGPALRIAMETPTACSFISDLLDEFSTQNPLWEVALYSGSRSEILEQLLRRKVDVALVSGGSETSPVLNHMVHNEPELHTQTLFGISDGSQHNDLEAVWFEPQGENIVIKKFKMQLVSAYGFST